MPNNTQPNDESLEMVVRAETDDRLSLPPKLEDLHAQGIYNFFNKYNEVLQQAVMSEMTRRGKTVVAAEEGPRQIGNVGFFRGLAEDAMKQLSVYKAAYISRKGSNTILNGALGTGYGLIKTIANIGKAIPQFIAFERELRHPERNLVVDTEVIDSITLGANLPADEALEQLLVYTFLEERIKHGNSKVYIHPCPKVSPPFQPKVRMSGITADMHIEARILYRPNGALSREYRAERDIIDKRGILPRSHGESLKSSDPALFRVSAKDGIVEVSGYINQEGNPEFDKTMIIITTGNKKYMDGSGRKFIDAYLANIANYVEQPQRISAGLIELQSLIKDRFAADVKESVENVPDKLHTVYFSVRQR